MGIRIAAYLDLMHPSPINFVPRICRHSVAARSGSNHIVSTAAAHNRLLRYKEGSCKPATVALAEPDGSHPTFGFWTTGYLEPDKFLNHESAAAKTPSVFHEFRQAVGLLQVAFGRWDVYPSAISDSPFFSHLLLAFIHLLRLLSLL
jgi:hypothetical protein